MTEEPYVSRQTYVEGKGEVYCGKSRGDRCGKSSWGAKFPGKKKCKGCRWARYRPTKREQKQLP